MRKSANPPRDGSIRDFPTIVAADSCSIWNILSSKTLTLAVKGAGPHFVLAEYVKYECLGKKRSSIRSHDISVQKILRNELAEKRYFSVMSLDVEDLQLLARSGVHKVIDRGEIAAIALAQKISGGFLTDDYDARMTGEATLGISRARSTPHLVGWLIYSGHLTDGDIPQIIADNDAARNERGQIGSFINICYLHAMGLRLRERGVA